MKPATSFSLHYPIIHLIKFELLELVCYFKALHQCIIPLVSDMNMLLESKVFGLFGHPAHNKLVLYA